MKAAPDRSGQGDVHATPQQFVEWTIAHRLFTLNRQQGAQLFGRLFRDAPVDLSYALGVFTGRGGALGSNDDDQLMYTSRLLDADDRRRRTTLQGGFIQAGLLPHGVFPAVSPQLEFGLRYASVDLEDPVLQMDGTENRPRLQWDVRF